MKKGYQENQLQGVLKRIKDMGCQGHLSKGVERTVIGVVGQTHLEMKESLELLPGVEDVVPISKPFKLSSREFKPEEIGRASCRKECRSRWSPYH